MMVIFIILVVAGVEVAATTPPKEPQGRCPIAPMECGPNSHYEKCSKICPPQNCSYLIDTHWLCENPGCKPECRCNDGFYRNQNGTCISRDECLAQCGPLERYVSDYSYCRRTCANYKVTAPRSLCKPYSGCVCEEGRVRLNDDATGPCVLPKDCTLPICNKPNEVAKDCGSHCEIWICEDYNGTDGVSSTVCVRGCYCREGYARNAYGDCIRKEKCPPPSCSKNEKYMTCGTACPITCDNFKDPPKVCTQQCIEGCFCKEGYVRNLKDNTCTKPEYCPPPTCSKNEKYMTCGTACPITCDNFKDPPKVCTQQCIKGCFCKEGYVRNLKDNTCTKPEHCPPQTCSKNEKYMTCGTACPITCDNFKDPPKVCTQQCIEGCFCKEGYVRNLKDNTCTKPEYCPPPTCSKNEKYMTCGTACPITCDNFKDPPKVCTQQCIKGCFCKEGYVRNLKDNTCTKPEHCPPPACRENEKYMTCGTACPITCDNFKDPPKVCTQQCIEGCFCKEGYVRNLKDNTCTKPEHCPPLTCRKNENYMTCGTACPITCENFKDPPKVCTQQCIEGCFCKEGYVRNLKDNTCTKPEHCPPPTCRKNEKYMTCGTACPITCDNFKDPPKICTQQCIEGCFCKEGYVRNLKDNTCTKPEHCPPPTCRKNEKYMTCGTACPITCDNFKDPPKICTQQCIEGCFCKKGYVRNLKDNTCTKPEHCPPPACRENEKYMTCGTACPITCDNFKDPPKVCTQQCIEGCFCKEGYVRNLKDNTCTKPEHCPPQTCRKNEKYMTCGTACPITCDNFKDPPKVCTQQCIEGCFCKEGYVRNLKDNTCTKPEHCPPQTCRKNEKYMTCGTACPITCDNFKDPPKVCTQQCIEGCFCKEGYVRNLKDNTCTKPEHCPPQTCRKNEKYMTCGTACPITCDNFKDPPKVCTQQCIEGCFCKEGYVRNLKDNTCTKPEHCPPPTCRKNEKYMTCGTACPITCENFKDPPKVCTQQCIEGCFCKEGYVRNLKDNTCTKPEHCPPPTCKKNEKYMTCGTACPMTCDNFKDPPKVCTQQCIEGCFCKEGYVRNLKDNTCTKPEHCPDKITCPADEVYDQCSAHCEPTCEHHGPDRACTAICKPGCRCREGLVRRKDKKCVKLDQCPGPIYPANEVYDPCIMQKCPPGMMCAQVCSPGCRCKDGYVRDKKGQCVTPPTCKKNEKYMTCGTACPMTCDNFKDPPKVCTQQCIEGCFCKEGYVRNLKDNTCTKPEHCPDKITCPADEVYDQCSAHCEPTCEHHGPDRACTAICKPGCRCREGLVRRKDKKCVKLDQCPGPICPANEVYDPCIMQKCPPGMMCAQVCSPGCRCKDGYVRDKKGQCVTQNIVCPPNEVMSECYNSCHTTCKTRLRSDGRMCHLACIETGCLCKEGYLRHDNGTCVPISQCSLPRCNDDETYSKCGTACPPTCQNRGDNCTACTKECVEDCFCNKGLVRSDDGKCIKLKECAPRICGCNEKFDPCPPTCPPTDGCSNMWSKFNCTNAIKCCKPQCRCKPGYLRKDKVCVPIKQCLN